MSESLEVTLYGTRGTVAVGGKDVEKFGGMTTCLRIDSPCIPSDTWLVIDAGTGFIPLAKDGLAAGVKKVDIAFTHYHHDHNGGLPIAAWIHMKQIPMRLWGPIISPAEIVKSLMTRPLFPVSYPQIASHLKCKAITNPPGMVFAVHPESGMKLFRLDEFERAEKSTVAQLSFGQGVRHNVSECMVIRMQQTNHPDYTISYRFEERPTGKVFVFATDHENQCETPATLQAHFKDADLLIADCQYSDSMYESRAGYGHGTPAHCVKLAQRAGAKRLGLTHHDPWSTDENVVAMEREAMSQAEVQGYSGEVFACADYLKILV